MCMCILILSLSLTVLSQKTTQNPFKCPWIYTDPSCGRKRQVGETILDTMDILESVQLTCF